MKALLPLLFALLAGCRPAQMDRQPENSYQATTEKLYTAYLSGTRDEAKEALRFIIEFLESKPDDPEVAHGYLIDLAYSYGRLALVQEAEGYGDAAASSWALSESYAAEFFEARSHDGLDGPADLSRDQIRAFLLELDSNHEAHWLKADRANRVAGSD
jgi:hypothetical protein